MSSIFLEERQHHLSNKGILDMVQDSKKTIETKDIDANLSRLSKVCKPVGYNSVVGSRLLFICCPFIVHIVFSKRVKNDLGVLE